MARVEAMMPRRRRATTEIEPVSGEVQVRQGRFEALVGGVALDLARRECELVDLFVRAQAQVLEREEIYRHVWGYEMAHGDRSVDVFVLKLRKKLSEASPQWRYIHAHSGSATQNPARRTSGLPCCRNPWPPAETRLRSTATDASARAGAWTKRRGDQWRGGVGVRR
jgi:Transcriptional regulatory protein, C terminal